MKMQIAYLPGNKWMLVLSETDSKPSELAVDRLKVEGGAAGVFVTSEPVELEGEIAYERAELPAELEKTDLQPFIDKIQSDAASLGDLQRAARPSAENRSWTGEI